MISRPVDNEDQRKLIGIWEDNGKIIALATFELCLGEVYFCIDPSYNFLIEEMLLYAEKSLSKDGVIKIIIDDNDREFQKIALDKGYFANQEREHVSVLDLNNKIQYNLPDGYKIISMADGWDFYQYNKVMWRGFDHEGEPSQDKGSIEWRKTMLSSPHIIPELILSVIAPNGDYVSHCGIWYKHNTNYAYVEPVATDPNYRKLGLGKAVVLKAALEAQHLGAKKAYVCSSQQFYYRIGFYPASTETWWEKKL